MIPNAFDYYSPTTLGEAISLLTQHSENAKVLAGGHSLLPMMKFRIVEPQVVIDINQITGLSGVQEVDGFLKIGGLTRHAELEHSDLIRARYPIIADAGKVIADPLVRNRGTVAGSLCHADPAGDWASVMLALRAELVMIGPQGKRTISIDDFLIGPFTTALAAGEILTEIRVPIPKENYGSAYLKLERKVGDFATAAVGVHVELGKKGLCTQVGISLTGVGPKNLRAGLAEDLLRGKLLDEETVQKAGKLAAEDSRPTANERGSEEYKRDLVRVLTVRGVKQSLERALRM
jgi:aerobic carbon-monoxide dehydrogenase medium subunit